MLSFYLTDREGRERPLDSVLTAVLDGDIGVPADSLTVTCPFDGGVRENADRIRACDGERVVFDGQLDTVTTEKRAEGIILKLSARSAVAGLLDGEAEPVTYSSPSDRLIALRHLAPFGIRAVNQSDAACREPLQIVKGMSHWQVLQAYCRNRYGCEPRVTGDGRAFLRGEPEEGEVLFADTGGGVRYYALRESRRRHCLLSEIRLKYEQSGAYGGVIKNTDPEAALMNRVRYVNAAADKTTVVTAEKMLANSNRGSLSLLLRCGGCHTDALGRRASVEDSLLGSFRGLLVRQVRYAADSRGERSVITLIKEK